MWLSGPNTSFANYPIERVAGSGYVDYTIPDLLLLNGRYQITVTAVDSTMLHVYDLHDRLYKLTVHSDGLDDKFGMIAMPGIWGWKTR